MRRGHGGPDAGRAAPRLYRVPGTLYRLPCTRRSAQHPEVLSRRGPYAYFCAAPPGPMRPASVPPPVGAGARFEKFSNRV
jgi:hypothetical protein